MFEFAERIVSAKKIVFTITLDKSIWANTELAKGSLLEEISKLKKQDGKHIVVYRGSSFVYSLIKERLIDEFQFYINPIALGKGVGIFDQIDNFQQLRLKKSITFNSGIILLIYESI